MASGVITVGIDPMIHRGPITLARHGLTIAARVAIGGLFAGREARRRGLDPQPLQTMGAILWTSIALMLVGAVGLVVTTHKEHWL